MSLPHTLISSRRSHLQGTIKAIQDLPGDKSISHRALILAALANGKTRIDGLNNGEDVQHTVSALQDLGVEIQAISPTSVNVTGIGHTGSFKSPGKPLFLGNSGTTARLLCGMLTPFPVQVTLHGDASLLHRPMRRAILPLSQMGAEFVTADNMTLPLTITGTVHPKNHHYQVPIASAQVKTAIILAALRTPGKTIIEEELSTRDHTERLLRYMGYPITTSQIDGAGYRIEVDGNHPLNAQDMTVSADTSAAAFLTVAVLITPHSHMTIEGVCWNVHRRKIFSVLQSMGGKILVKNHRNICGEEVVDLEVWSSSLHSIDLEAPDAPALIDEYPILSVAAACAHGTSTFKGLRELRYKESDRLDAINDHLNLCGIESRIADENLIIRGHHEILLSSDVTIQANQDHRIAMAFYILGMVTRGSITIQGSETIASSFPKFIAIFDEVLSSHK